VDFGTPRYPQIGPAEGKARQFYEKELGKWMGSLGLKSPDELTRVIAPDYEDPDEVLQLGSLLYRRHCLHCHGLTGDGRGPTGPWVHPHPRDYRKGVFKFISTPLSSKKPRRDDLKRTLRQGVDGTSMPSFGLLPEYELDYLVSYVMHLSVRGQVEFDTMRALLAPGGKENLKEEIGSGGKTLSIEEYVHHKTAGLLVAWAQSNSTPPEQPPKYEEPKTEAERHASISRGYQIFLKRDCIGACHTDFGRQAPLKFDDWGTLMRPANLTVSTYRGGRRPIDLYWRFKIGIPGTAMPSAGAQDKEYWDLVNFVRALPFPRMLPKDVRLAVYGSAEIETRPQGKQVSSR
jgi:mono/diheme cytochrome c family protein